MTLYKNGGVTWASGFLATVLQTLLFFTSRLALFISKNLFLMSYNLGSPSHEHFVNSATRPIQDVVANVVPLLEEQGLHLELERNPENAVIIPPWVYSVLWVVVCNLAVFVLLKILSCLLLQRSTVRKKAD